MQKHREFEYRLVCRVCLKPTWSIKQDPVTKMQTDVFDLVACRYIFLRYIVWLNKNQAQYSEV